MTPESASPLPDPIDQLQHELTDGFGGTAGIEGRKVYGDRYEVLLKQADDGAAVNIAFGQSRANLRNAAAFAIVSSVFLASLIEVLWLARLLP